MLQGRCSRSKGSGWSQGVGVVANELRIVGGLRKSATQACTNDVYCRKDTSQRRAIVSFASSLSELCHALKEPLLGAKVARAAMLARIVRYVSHSERHACIGGASSAGSLGSSVPGGDS